MQVDGGRLRFRDDAVETYSTIHFPPKRRRYKRKRISDGIADSGTSTHLSRIREDFDTVESTPTVSITSASGRVERVGYRGTFAGNLLGLSTGVYYPDLMCDRLISIIQLNSEGWGVFFAPSGSSSFAENKKTTARVPIYKKGGLNLPHIPTFGEMKDLQFDEEDDIDIDTILANFVEYGDSCEGTSLYVSELLAHRRMAHLIKTRRPCPCCQIGKKRAGSHRKQRPKKYWPKEPLERLALDYWGSVKPQSMRSCRLLAVFVCDLLGKFWVFPIRTKDQIYSVARKLIPALRAKYGVDLGDKVTKALRSDNEPVLTGVGWSTTCVELEVLEEHSTPMNPQQNSTVERKMGTIAGGVRSTLGDHTDRKLWDYAAEFVAFCHGWKRCEFPKAAEWNGLSPNEVLDLWRRRRSIQDMPAAVTEVINAGPPAVISKLRRFGSLSWVKIFDQPKLAERSQACVLLGMSDTCSGYKFGTYVRDKRTKSGFHWRDDIYSVDATIWETHAVPDVSLLKPGRVKLEELERRCRLAPDGSLTVPSEAYVDRPPALEELVLPGDEDEASEANGAENRDRDGRGQGGSSSSSTRPTQAARGDVVHGQPVGGVSGTAPETGESSGSIQDSSRSVVKRPKTENDYDLGRVVGLPHKKRKVVKVEQQGIIVGDKEDDEDSDAGSEARDEGTVNEKKLVGPSQKKRKSEIESDKDKVVRVPMLRPKRRGRPPGSKDKKPRARRGNNKNKGAAKTYAAYMVWAVLMLQDSIARQKEAEQQVMALHAMNEANENDLEEGEEIIETHCFISIAEALKSEDRPRWLEAMTIERLRLESFQTWRKLEEDEYKKMDRRSVLPCVCLLSRKRCGRFKARLVILGNRAPSGEVETFSPVVGLGAMRASIITCAKFGNYLGAFDVSNAFVQADPPLDSDAIYIRLPESFREEIGDDGYRKLLKALYGLRQSPRIWQQWFCKWLTDPAQGWEVCEAEPCTMRKWSASGKGYMFMSIYVDDVILHGPVLREINCEISKILAKFPGNKIEPDAVNRGGKCWQRFDIVGLDVLMRPGECLITMERYILKSAARFGMEKATPSPSPSFNEAQVVQSVLKEGAVAVEFDARAFIGTLSWIANTARPDIMQPVNSLARLTSKTITAEFRAASKKVLRFSDRYGDRGYSL